MFFYLDFHFYFEAQGPRVNNIEYLQLVNHPVPNPTKFNRGKLEWPQSLQNW